MTNTFPRAIKRSHLLVVLSVVVSLVVVLVAVDPALAHGGGKSALGIRMSVYTNDDGRRGFLDPGDTGTTSVAYDRWGRWSSDDPTEPGMDPIRIDSDVARCAGTSVDADTVRVKLDAAYPGYVCSFAVVFRNKAGSDLIVGDVSIDVDPGLELVEIEGPAEGDRLAKGWYLYGIYGVVVLQEAPQHDALEFDIEVSFVDKSPRPRPPRRCGFCWRYR